MSYQTKDGPQSSKLKDTVPACPNCKQFLSRDTRWVGRGDDRTEEEILVCKRPSCGYEEWV